MTKHIVQISTGNSNGCKICDFHPVMDDFSKMVNHYIENHDYKLLHVGTETTLGPNDVPWHTTVAVVGK